MHLLSPSRCILEESLTLHLPAVEARTAKEVVLDAVQSGPPVNRGRGAGGSGQQLLSVGT